MNPTELTDLVSQLDIDGGGKIEVEEVCHLNLLCCSGTIVLLLGYLGRSVLQYVKECVSALHCCTALPYH